jgi:hypothetical protein
MCSRHQRTGFLSYATRGTHRLAPFGGDCLAPNSSRSALTALGRACKGICRQRNAKQPDKHPDQGNGRGRCAHTTRMARPSSSVRDRQSARTRGIEGRARTGNPPRLPRRRRGTGIHRDRGRSLWAASAVSFYVFPTNKHATAVIIVHKICRRPDFSLADEPETTILLLMK